jgi:hypothetical protein
MPDPIRRITIRTGTVDEIGPVEVKLVNVHERPERPGTLSVLLILPDAEHVMAVGDHIYLSGSKVTLSAITPASAGAHDIAFDVAEFIFSDKFAADRKAWPDLDRVTAPVPIPPLDGFGLRDALQQASVRLLASLTAEGIAPPAIAGWHTESQSSTEKDWTGEEWGPSHDHRRVAEFGARDLARFTRLECSLRLTDLRYSPDETFRFEMSGWWCVNERSCHLFARADPPALFSNVLFDVSDVTQRNIILETIAAGAA